MIFRKIAERIGTDTLVYELRNDSKFHYFSTIFTVFSTISPLFSFNGLWTILLYGFDMLPFRCPDKTLLFTRDTADGSRRFETYMNPVAFSTGFSACRRYIFGRRQGWHQNL